MYTEYPLTKREMRDICRAFGEQYDTVLSVVFVAQEDSRFDRAARTLQLGQDVQATPSWAGYYLIYRLLRGIHQTQHPEAYKGLVRRSIDYRIAGNGQCAKWAGDRWQPVVLRGIVADWRALADNLPAAKEADEWALPEAYDMLTSDTERDNLHQFHYWATPKTTVSEAEYTRLFDAIDRALDEVRS